MFRLKRSKADRLFSYLIRHRSGWVCERCRTSYEPPNGLECSHFWGRGNKSVRFDPQNALALCYGCHRYFTANPEEHKEFVRLKLGQEDYDKLNFKARIPQKIDEYIICLWLEKELEKDGIGHKYGQKFFKLNPLSR